MNPFPESYRLYYHDNLKVNKNYNSSFYELFRIKYAQHTDQLTNHILSVSHTSWYCVSVNI